MCVSGSIAVLSLEVLEQSNQLNFLAIQYMNSTLRLQAGYNYRVTFAAENLRIKAQSAAPRNII